MHEIKLLNKEGDRTISQILKEVCDILDDKGASLSVKTFEHNEEIKSPELIESICVGLGAGITANYIWSLITSISRRHKDRKDFDSSKYIEINGQKYSFEEITIKIVEEDAEK